MERRGHPRGAERPRARRSHVVEHGGPGRPRVTRDVDREGPGRLVDLDPAFRGGSKVHLDDDAPEVDPGRSPRHSAICGMPQNGAHLDEDIVTRDGEEIPVFDPPGHEPDGVAARVAALDDLDDTALVAGVGNGDPERRSVDARWSADRDLIGGREALGRREVRDRPGRTSITRNREAAGLSRDRPGHGRDRRKRLAADAERTQQRGFFERDRRAPGGPVVR